MYIVRVQGLSGEVDDIFMYTIVKCNDKNDELVMHQNVLQETVAFLLTVRCVNVIGGIFPSLHRKMAFFCNREQPNLFIQQ